MMTNYNPYGYNPYPQQDLGSLIEQAQKLYVQSPYNPQVQPNSAMNNRGDYIRINDYKDVENYPARTDGVATLLFDFANNIFYSKKLLNGKPSIQTFSFNILNNIGEEQNEQPQNEEPKEETQPDKMQIVIDYIEKMNKKITTLTKEVNKIKKEQKAVNSNEV